MKILRVAALTCQKEGYINMNDELPRHVQPVEFQNMPALESYSKYDSHSDQIFDSNVDDECMKEWVPILNNVHPETTQGDVEQFDAWDIDLNVVQQDESGESIFTTDMTHVKAENSDITQKSESQSSMLDGADAQGKMEHSRKKPITGYMMFSKENFHKVKETIGANNTSTVGVEMGKLWRKMEPGERQEYQDKANKMNELQRNNVQCITKVKSLGVRKKRTTKKVRGKNVLNHKSEQASQSHGSVSSHEDRLGDSTSVETSSSQDGSLFTELLEPGQILQKPPADSLEWIPQQISIQNQEPYQQPCAEFTQYHAMHPPRNRENPSPVQQYFQVPNWGAPTHQPPYLNQQIPAQMHTQDVYSQQLPHHLQHHQYRAQFQPQFHLQAGHNQPNVMPPGNYSTSQGDINFDYLPFLSGEQLTKIILEQHQYKQNQSIYIDMLLKTNLRLNGILKKFEMENQMGIRYMGRQCP